MFQIFVSLPLFKKLDAYVATLLLSAFSCQREKKQTQSFTGKLTVDFPWFYYQYTQQVHLDFYGQEVIKLTVPSSVLPADHAVPGAAEVPVRPEEEDGLRCPFAPSAGSVLHRCAAPAAFHHRDEDEEHADAGQEQSGRRDHQHAGTGVRRETKSQTKYFKMLAITIR